MLRLYPVKHKREGEQAECGTDRRSFASMAAAKCERSLCVRGLSRVPRGAGAQVGEYGEERGEGERRGVLAEKVGPQIPRVMTLRAKNTSLSNTVAAFAAMECANTAPWRRGLFNRKVVLKVMVRCTEAQDNRRAGQCKKRVGARAA